jgi:hypothetical protein
LTLLLFSITCLPCHSRSLAPFHPRLKKIRKVGRVHCKITQRGFRIPALMELQRWLGHALG